MKIRTHTVNNNGQAMGMHIGIGIGIALLMSILLSAGVTSLVAKGAINENDLDLMMFFSRAISILAGALTATAIHKSGAIAIISAVCLGYIFVLIALVIIAFNGMFQGLGSGILSVLAGAVAAFLIGLKPSKRRKYARHYTK